MGRVKRVGVLIVFLVGVTVAIVVWAAMHDSSVRRSTNPFRDDTIARGIAQALDLYAEEHKDRYPNRERWLQELVELGLIEQGFGDGYEMRYAGGQRTLDFEQAVFFIESEERPETAHVGFADGSVRAVDLEEARALIE